MVCGAGNVGKPRWSRTLPELAQKGPSDMPEALRLSGRAFFFFFLDKIQLFLATAPLLPAVRTVLNRSFIDVFSLNAMASLFDLQALHLVVIRDPTLTTQRQKSPVGRTPSRIVRSIVADVSYRLGSILHVQGVSWATENRRRMHSPDSQPVVWTRPGFSSFRMQGVPVI